MKKILIAFDGNHFSEGAFAFARRLNELQKVLLVGAFLPQSELANLWSYADSTGTMFVPLLETDDADLVQQNIARFEKECADNGIAYKVRKNFSDLALPSLKDMSRFCDLVIIGSQVFYEQAGAGLPNEYLQEALHHLRCPVLLVPEKFSFPDELILAYNGTTDSIFAIKMFAYLFPEFRHLPAKLVYAKENEFSIPEKNEISELVDAHFTHASFLVLEASPKKEFAHWASGHPSAMIVCGSYGRSGISQLFRKPFIRDVIADHRLPIFIAHR